MRMIEISEAKASFSHLIKMLQKTNEPVIIGKVGKPVVVRSAFREDVSPRKLGGSWEAKVKISEDFEQPDDRLVYSFCHSSLFPDK